jgi:hypothetical protein
MQQLARRIGIPVKTSTLPNRFDPLRSHYRLDPISVPVDAEIDTDHLLRAAPEDLPAAPDQQLDRGEAGRGRNLVG